MGDVVRLDELDNLRLTDRYTDDYKNAVFYVWYNRGRCGINSLSGYIDHDQNGRTPSIRTLIMWKDEYKWEERADKLDIEIKAKVDGEVIAEKAEMLKRHALTGRRMQDIAIEYLEEHKDDLKPNSAVRLLVDGIRIERESLGLPSIVSEVIKTSDEDLLKSITDLLGSVEELEVVDSE